MAKLNPPIDVIKRLKVQPTEGEWRLLNFLLQNLDDTYEIFFQPFVNGDNPDIAVIRRDSGLLIIEVKDWNLSHYSIDEKTKWHLRKDNVPIKSPLKQVESYKENLFKLHSEELFQRNVSNKNNWATVGCAVYFQNASENQLTHFLLDNFQSDTDEHNYSYYRKFVSYFGILGQDSLNKGRLDSLLSKFWLNRKSKYFDDVLYNSLVRYLQSPIHQLEDGKNITYTKEQQELIRSEVRPRRKIKGVAGCGKTLVMSKRAVNAHVRTGSTVLILTFNLSLKNYVHDRINDVRENFYWNNFYITNYHQFFKAQANHYNLEITGLDCWEDTSFFEPVKNSISKYDVVLIDEIQDYMQEWIDIIATYFTHPETEFVVFGDEKQNIYEREMDENNEPKVRTIVGAWNRSLNTSHRFTSNIGNIALKFQREMFNQKYQLDDLKVLSQIDFEKRIVEYHYFHMYTAKSLLNSVYSILLKHKIHPSDVGILCSKVELIRELDYLIRDVKKEKTTTTFESQEEFDEIKKEETAKLEATNCPDDEFEWELKRAMHDRLEEIRKLKKNHFWMKTGTMKLSTVHSFKGWEIDTLFLFVEDEEDEHSFTNAELVYTGLTRARRNLIVYNLGNTDYDNFFKREIENSYEVRKVEAT